MSEREMPIAALHSVGLSWFDAEQIIAAIEAKAVAAERARITDAVEGLHRFAWLGGQVGAGSFLKRAAVLAIVNPEADHD